ncbi:NAD-dependent protein deacylase SRT2 isoform X1 [Canna indica]|uniref:NAD-dependent protein deacylase SRT2 isoform X1 n=1 Tax=Canna indica TaxID=4628 RepID=A0AAQ3Q344_9LILI|nr:NAD-dependent protein deacylase SRT2 isoform X1 [Canna indica]
MASQLTICYSFQFLCCLSKGSRLHMSSLQSTLCGLFCNRRGILSKCCTSRLLTSGSYSTYRSTLKDQNGSYIPNLNDRKIIPDSNPPSIKDNLLHKFIDRSDYFLTVPSTSSWC